MWPVLWNEIIWEPFFRLFGWLVDSSPPEQGAIGATLEIQRSQQIEALEQYQIQQQARMNARRLPNQVFRQSKYFFYTKQGPRLDFLTVGADFILNLNNWTYLGMLKAFLYKY